MRKFLHDFLEAFSILQMITDFFKTYLNYFQEKIPCINYSNFLMFYYIYKSLHFLKIDFHPLQNNKDRMYIHIVNVLIKQFSREIFKE